MHRPPPDHLLLLRMSAPVFQASVQTIRRWFMLLCKDSRLIQKAVTQGLGGMLYRNLSAAELFSRLPLPQQRRLRSAYLTTVATNIQLEHALKEILAMFNRPSLPCVLLKGAALNTEVYEDPGLRDMTDIDLWIPPSHVAEAEKRLTDIGYRQDPLYPSTYRKGLATIDLHRHFLGADRIRSRTRIFGADADEVFQRSVPVSVLGSRALSLDPWDQVLFLWLHALKHNLGKLAWLADIQYMTASWRADEWQRFQVRCRELGHTVSEISIRWLLQHLDADGCRATEMQVSRLGILRRYAFRRFIKSGAMPPWASFVLFLPPGRSADRLRVTLESIYPRAEILHQSFPSIPQDPAWRLYVLRTLQIGMSAMTFWKKS